MNLALVTLLATVLHVAPPELHRALNEARTAPKPVTIELSGGTCFLDKPIVLGPADAGLTIAAARGATPVLSGGRRVSGWQRDGDGVWSASVPVGSAFRELWVNGARRVRSRHPNTGYLKVAEPIGEKDWTKGGNMFRFCSGDLKPWPSLTNAELIVMNRWTESHLPIASITESNRTVAFAKRSVFQLEAGDLYYVENCREAFDAPGEWLLDGAAGRLLYRPLPGEDVAKAEVIVPVLAQVVRLENVGHVTLRGLTFAHTEWALPKNSSGFVQAAFGVPGAVFGDSARGCVIERCRFEHLGNYGLELARGCQDNRVTACEFADLGAGGVKIGETTCRQTLPEQNRNNEVSDCRIHDGGKLFHSAIGVWIGESSGNRLVHNSIHDFYYSGISIGWTWGYGASLAQSNVVEWNEIHHIGKLSNGDGPILSDMGGIYTLGNQQGGVIRNNLWHDIAGRRYGGWGIYFDEGTTGVVAENNLVYRTTHGGFHQHYGKDNIVRNNIFAFARDWQLQRTRAESHNSFTFERNIVVWDTGKLLDGKWGDDKFVVSSNLFWRADGKPVELSARLQAGNSLVADPRFADPKADDYRLRWNSPADKISFRPFDLRAVGPRAASSIAQ